MKRETIQVGSFYVNCSILSDGQTAWIVDPGSDAERITAVLERDGLLPRGILLTHAHFDHIGGIAELQNAHPDLPVYVHDADLSAFGHPMNQFAPDYPLAPRPKNIKPASSAAIDGIVVIDTPGHTPGGVCYYLPDDRLLLSGDTLFAGSIGRTDLPGGDMATLLNSLDKLKSLPDNTTVVPGHGPTTTIAVEKTSNPFLCR